jgi:NAD(P)-dependent dehydrogenase (short-subunit alcohol dehydrogenase family)
MAHVLVIGGTGKLSGFVRFLAARGNLVSVVASNEEELNKLTAEAAAAGEKIFPLLVDYRDTARLLGMMEEATRLHGGFQLAVVRIHPPSPEVRNVIANFLNSHSPICRFFEVLSEEDYLTLSEEALTSAEFDRILYRRILLGTVKQKGQPRWPNSEEIAEAAIRAVRDDLREIVIGTLRMSA